MMIDNQVEDDENSYYGKCLDIEGVTAHFQPTLTVQYLFGLGGAEIGIAGQNCCHKGKYNKKLADLTDQQMFTFVSH
jgi:hypothetical protein